MQSLAVELHGLPTPGDVIGDKYRVEGLLGTGGFGAVFAARHTVTGRMVALKYLLKSRAQDAQSRKRFLREAQAAARIQHPNVVDVYDVGEHEGACYLVLDYLHGSPLSKVFAEGIPDPQAFLGTMIAVCRGVHAAHAQGVVHRDLKPDNIFLCTTLEGELLEPKVLDFGVAKVLDQVDERMSMLTMDGSALGTPCYMAPEQLISSSHVDSRADVWALGVILYEGLTGALPFASTNVLAIARGDFAKPSLLNPYLEPELERIVLSAMTLLPQERTADVATLARSLEPFAGGARFERMVVNSLRPPDAQMLAARAAYEVAFSRQDTAIAQTLGLGALQVANAQDEPPALSMDSGILASAREAQEARSEQDRAAAPSAHANEADSVADDPLEPARTVQTATRASSAWPIVIVVALVLVAGWSLLSRLRGGGEKPSDVPANVGGASARP